MVKSNAQEHSIVTVSQQSLTYVFLSLPTLTRLVLTIVLRIAILMKMFAMVKSMKMVAKTLISVSRAMLVDLRDNFVQRFVQFTVQLKKNFVLDL